MATFQGHTTVFSPLAKNNARTKTCVAIASATDTFLNLRVMRPRAIEISNRGTIRIKKGGSLFSAAGKKWSKEPAMSGHVSLTKLALSFCHPLQKYVKITITRQI